MDSILNTIKKMILGTSFDEDTSFDTDIIVSINSAFADLNDIGVGPSEGFSILDDIPVWSEFTQDNTIIESVKSYVYFKTKLDFDPPSNSSVLASMQNRVKELEWRLNVRAENMEKQQ